MTKLDGFDEEFYELEYARGNERCSRCRQPASYWDFSSERLICRACYLLFQLGA